MAMLEERIVCDSFATDRNTQHLFLFHEVRILMKCFLFYRKPLVFYKIKKGNALAQYHSVSDEHMCQCVAFFILAEPTLSLLLFLAKMKEPLFLIWFAVTGDQFIANPCNLFFRERKVDRCFADHNCLSLLCRRSHLFYLKFVADQFIHMRFAHAAHHTINFQHCFHHNTYHAFLKARKPCVTGIKVNLKYSLRASQSYTLGEYLSITLTDIFYQFPSR